MQTLVPSLANLILHPQITNYHGGQQTPVLYIYCDGSEDYELEFKLVLSSSDEPGARNRFAWTVIISGENDKAYQIPAPDRRIAVLYIEHNHVGRGKLEIYVIKAN